MNEDKEANRIHRSWRRFSERLLARNRHRLDEAEGIVARQLDFWNRKLAERAVPQARRERVEAMARKRDRAGPRLSVVPGGSRKDDDGLS